MKFENTVLNECGRSVYRFALSLTQNEEDAHDVTQQAFLLLFEKKPHFSCVDQMRVWLIRVAKNTIYNMKKRFDNSRTVPLESAGEISVTDPLSFELCELLSTLSEDYREVIELYYVEDMTVPEISKALRLSQGTVKSRLSRARAKLKKIYEEEIL